MPMAAAAAVAMLAVSETLLRTTQIFADSSCSADPSLGIGSKVIAIFLDGWILPIFVKLHVLPRLPNLVLIFMFQNNSI